MARPEKHGVQEESLRGWSHRTKVRVVRECDDVPRAESLIEDERHAGHQLERARPAKTAHEQVAAGEIHEVAAIGRFKRRQDKFCIREWEDLCG